ncbi:MAG: hypothetical protein JW741_04445 [Sedimentisphaerales bacterium]|nr:hypothetical protein [Sedimentisphaerales bacterium]
MTDSSSASSQEELLRLREEGRISEAEYQNLLAAMQAPTAAEPQPDPNDEPQFRAFRRRVLTGGLVICAIGLPAGIVLHLPIVWILSIAGIVVAPIKLSRMKDSWLAGILANNKTDRR